MGPRNGPMYTVLEPEAADAGLPLHWPQRLPKTLPALAASEWARRNQPQEFPSFHAAHFEAHFALGEDAEDPDMIDRHARTSGIDFTNLHAELAVASADRFVTEGEQPV